MKEAVGASLLLWEPCHLITWETRKPNTVAKVDRAWRRLRSGMQEEGMWGAEEGLSGVCC